MSRLPVAPSSHKSSLIFLDALVLFWNRNAGSSRALSRKASGAQTAGINQLGSEDRQPPIAGHLALTLSQTGWFYWFSLLSLDPGEVFTNNLSSCLKVSSPCGPFNWLQFVHRYLEYYVLIRWGGFPQGNLIYTSGCLRGLWPVCTMDTLRWMSHRCYDWLSLTNRISVWVQTPIFLALI